jgi:hypothetical protein
VLAIIRDSSGQLFEKRMEVRTLADGIVPLGLPARESQQILSFEKK